MCKEVHAIYSGQAPDTTLRTFSSEGRAASTSTLTVLPPPLVRLSPIKAQTSDMSEHIEGLPCQ